MGRVLNALLYVVCVLPHLTSSEGIYAVAENVSSGCLGSNLRAALQTESCLQILILPNLNTQVQLGDATTHVRKTACPSGLWTQQ